MPEGIAFLDILIFAVIAIFLVLRLHSALGKRTGFEQKPPKKDAFTGEGMASPGAKQGKNPPSGNAPHFSHGEAEAQDQDEEQEKPLSGMGIGTIKKADRSFNEAQFMKGAKAAYKTILTAFAAGDTAQLKPLLGYEMQTGFATAILERRKAREELTIIIEKLESAKIAAAELREGLAIIAVDYVSRQKRVLREEAIPAAPAPAPVAPAPAASAAPASAGKANGQAKPPENSQQKPKGKILEGDPEKSVVFHDRWVFERDIASRDPNWLLVETESNEITETAEKTQG